MTAHIAPALAQVSAAHPDTSDRQKLAAAARQFEAIFLRQMLASARKADFGDKLIGGQGLETFHAMLDEHFAGVAAGTGAFGLASMIERQLAAQLSLARKD